MAIQKNINNEHVIEAILKIDSEEYQKDGIQQGISFLLKANFIRLNM
ncbi:hypothetical protein [Peribacillus simplex]|nr:hypothetical protein [Peribacillus simplex]